ncbi:MAG TPA: M20 family metallo-hydrolase [Geminicoccaceae bacterium]|nr:M20 family metallo-hydrolase [Geminicoccaceae bacterium]
MASEQAARSAIAAVDGQRLWRRHMAMAEIGAIAGDGVNRPALSPEDIRARALLLQWTRSRGWQAAVDPIANLFVRRPGRDPAAAPVVAGSHMDSQPTGGRFDGIFGVLAALEAMEALDAAGIETRHPIELVAWTNEEGGRFAPGAMGSAVFAGAIDLASCLDAVDAAGIRFGDALEATLAATPDLARRSFGLPIHAYVEPHIEQGPQLEASGHQIGVVSGIQGARWYVVEVEGEPGHAGTAPLRGRKDALCAAVRMIAALQELMHEPQDLLRFTVGRLDVEPNSPNTVPAKVTFSIDFRHPEARVLAERGGRIEAVCRDNAGPCGVRVSETFNRPPCVFPAAIVDVVERAAGLAGCRHMRMPSGAFHDANFIAELAPAGMIFVPCKNGISHSPAEYAKPEDLAAGARVLAATLVELAGVA